MLFIFARIIPNVLRMTSKTYLFLCSYKIVFILSLKHVKINKIFFNLQTKSGSLYAKLGYFNPVFTQIG